MAASSTTVGVDFIFRVRSVYPVIIASGTPVVISSRLTAI
jgi:hypothetical protein